MINIESNKFIDIEVCSRGLDFIERPLSDLTPQVAADILRKTYRAITIYYYSGKKLIELYESAFNYYVEKAEFTDLNTSGLYTSVLCEAVEKGYKTGLQILLNRKVDFYLNKALNNAVRENKKDLVELFINANVNLDLWQHDSRTALHVAVDRNRKDIVEMLLNGGADFSIGQELGLSPLQLVRRLDIAKLLTRVGADIDYESISTADKAIVEHFISIGARVDHTNKFGVSALYYAAKDNREDIAAVLLNAGATL